MTQTIDLSVFCTKEDSKNFRKDPWVFQGFRYAGNGFVLVRMPAEGEPDSNAPPEAQKYVDLFLPITDTLPWPEDGATTGTTECWDCDGAGMLNQDPCEKCNGTGDCTHCGGECGACNGVGVEKFSGKPCRVCRRTGRIDAVLHRQVGVHLIRGSIDRFIRVLPGVRYAAAQTNLHKPLPFVFDGGEGLVMGMKGPQE